jgi:hypothetical protein
MKLINLPVQWVRGTAPVQYMEPFFASKFKFKLLHKLELELELELFASPPAQLSA